jgi:L-ribulose-5-phosphate 4-epimerase
MKKSIKKQIKEIKTMIKYEDIRRQVLEAALRSNELGLIHGTSGNISIRDEKDNVVAITPSGIPYQTMKVEDIAIVDLDGNWIDGPYKPSSETPMHTGILKNRPDMNAVVHTHSKYATVMSMSGEPLPSATLPKPLPWVQNMMEMSGISMREKRSRRKYFHSELS